MDGVLDLARVGRGMHVLEIGSGWGALAIRAARERGARVTTLTLSTEQQALARQRAEDGRRRRTWSTCGCRTTATRPGSTTRSCRSR